jgi:hypothetical protein
MVRFVREYARLVSTDLEISIRQYIDEVVQQPPRDQPLCVAMHQTIVVSCEHLRWLPVAKISCYRRPCS